MSRPDAMDLDVASLLGLDAATFAEAPARARAAAPRSPAWLWVILPLAAALVLGVGMSWRSQKAEPVTEHTAVRAVEPELATGDAPRAMSLKIIDGPRRAARQRPRNIPMSELGPMPEGAASSHLAELEPVGAPELPTPAPPAQLDPVEPMALFADRELAPAEAPEAATQP